MRPFLYLVFLLAGSLLSRPAFAFSSSADYRVDMDTIKPTIECPPSDTFLLAAGQCTQVVVYTVIAMDDQPGTVQVIQAGGLASGAGFPIGATVNNFVAVDAGGNTATCSFTISVKTFTTALSCKSQTYILLDNDCIYPVVPADILEPGVNGCSANFLIEVDKTAPYGNGPWSPAIMTAADVNKTYQFRATDPATGNKCWVNGTVRDSMPPTLNCQDINISCAVSNLAPAYLKDSLGISAGMPVATDNCAGALTLNYVEMVVNLPCDTSNSLSGTITRAWTAADASGNHKTCLQKINRLRMLSDVVYPPGRTMGCGNPDLSQVVHASDAAGTI